MNGQQNTQAARSDLHKLRAIFRSAAMTSVRTWCRPVWSSIRLLCVLQVLFALSSLAVPLITRSLVDGAVSRTTALLWRYGILLAVVIAAARCIFLAASHISVRVSAELQQELQQMVTRTLLSRDYAALKTWHSGELVNRVFSDVIVVRKGVTEVLPELLKIAVSFLGAAVILIVMDWRFLPVMLVCSGTWAGLTLLLRRAMKERHKSMQEAEDALHASTQETVENIRVIKAGNAENRMLHRVEENAAHLRREQIRNGRLTLALKNGMGSMFDFSWLLAYLWGCIRIFRGDFTYGSLAALIPLIGRIQGPVANATGLLGQIYAVVASAERLQDILDLPEEEDRGTPEGFDSILLEDVSFRYEDDAGAVLMHVRGEIRKGDRIALTGPSGGGKTSLFQLLLGMYRPSSGTISVCSGERSVCVSKGTRGLFSYVPQGNTLLSGTLRENLTQFAEQASEEDIAAAVHTACLEELVQEIGLDAVIGERGVGISEGQAQRVAVARALLRKAPILLLDEATSALDEATEARLLENIAAEQARGCGVQTVVIVTHRPAARAVCDKHWKLEDGRLQT